MSNLPFTFAWVPEGTAFNPSTMNVLDEDIVSFEVKHDEGQVPTLNMVIRNPRIGLLNPGRNVWGWFAWDNNGTLVPIFFGILVGVPNDLFLEKVSIQLVARSPQFVANKQRLAETMKTSPYYDALWIDAGKRDDPDTVLEGWSSFWHIDRTTLNITASDILTGEDGTVAFGNGQHDATYESVSLKLGQPPLMNVRVETGVHWAQRSSGNFKVPTLNMQSYTGETLLSDWPKPGAGIGAGYRCQSSFTTDVFFVTQTPTASYSYSWSNTDPNPGQCSNASASTNSSGPALLSPNPLTVALAGYYQSGLCFPTTDPPANTPMSLTSSGIVVPLWAVSMDMTIRYDAHRDFSELLSFDLIANTQPILAAPTVSQNTELLSIQAPDVGEPLIEIKAWTNFASAPVGLTQLVTPNNPTTPGGLSFQICVVAGTAGATEPVFSDVPGAVTIDGTVHWASLGNTSITAASRWSAASYVPLGQITLMQNHIFNDFTGDFETVPGDVAYYICTRAGKTNSNYETITYTPPAISNVEAPPAPRKVSLIRAPTFISGVGGTVNDGSVQWTTLGRNPSGFAIPIGGSADNVIARAFFPTARGLRSIEYLISKARARLRYRARAVTIGWKCRFEDAVALSCRKNASLTDPRLPGGTATGKIISYSLIGSGDGKIFGKVEIGVTVGLGDNISPITGTPEYCDASYTGNVYQRYVGAMIAHGSNDITYSLPQYSAFDDGLSFPLTWLQVTGIGFLKTGDLETQKGKIVDSFAKLIELQYLQRVGSSTGGQGSTQQSGVPPDVAWTLEKAQLAIVNQATPAIMAANPVSATAVLKPCDGNGPFGGAYALHLSTMTLPQGIDLAAPSNL